MRNKKANTALAPAIALPMLIVTLLAASVISYLWIPWFLELQQQRKASVIKIVEAELSETIAYQQVITVYTKNIGTIKVVVNRAQVNGVIWEIIGSSTTINPNEICEIKIKQPHFPPIPPLKSGDEITIKISTEAGTYSVFKTKP